ncbi:MAG: hypothetical protein JWR52_905 [Marmoricola sp.]|nr:hypothetical protein [Marmoricola sp.]
MREGGVSLALAMTGLMLTGCGSTVPHIDHLAGSQVGVMAERQLEEMHPGMARGALTCPTLRFRVGASVRCVRVAELSGGRVVRMYGTVQVVSTRDGGDLHVAMDDDVAEFGVSAQRLQSDLTAILAKRTSTVPTTVRCPYLAGPTGTSVHCTVQLGKVTTSVAATVTGTDPATYRTSYRFTVHLPRWLLRAGSRG